MYDTRHLYTLEDEISVIPAIGDQIALMIRARSHTSDGKARRTMLTPDQADMLGDYLKEVAAKTRQKGQNGV